MQLSLILRNPHKFAVITSTDRARYIQLQWRHITDSSDLGRSQCTSIVSRIYCAKIPEEKFGNAPLWNSTCSIGHRWLIMWTENFICLSYLSIVNGVQFEGLPRKITFALTWRISYVYIFFVNPFALEANVKVIFCQRPDLFYRRIL